MNEAVAIESSEPALARGGDVRFMLALLQYTGPMVLWERTAPVLFRGAGSERVDPFVESYRRRGFGPWSGEQSGLGWLDEWLLSTLGRDLMLSHRGQLVERFPGAASEAPDGWFTELEARGWAICVVGSELSLERPEGQRITAALESGVAIAGACAVEVGTSAWTRASLR